MIWENCYMRWIVMTTYTPLMICTAWRYSGFEASWMWVVCIGLSVFVTSGTVCVWVTDRCKERIHSSEAEVDLYRSEMAYWKQKYDEKCESIAKLPDSV